MAFRKTLAHHHRLFHLNNISPLTRSSRLNTTNEILTTTTPPPPQTAFKREFLTSRGGGGGDHAGGDGGFFRRFLQKRAIVQSAVSTKVPSSMAIGDRLIEKLKEMNMSKDRLNLDGLVPPTRRPLSESSDHHDYSLREISIKDAKKLLKLAHLEKMKSTLRKIEMNSISYSEFVQICVDGSNSDQGLEFAKMLDESGAVIVLGNVVFLRPEQVAKAIEGVIPLSIAQPNDPRRKELEMMEKEKTLIDERAETLVRRELWGGLAFLVAQTAGLMRLTFWELSWDVMEPICFFISSVYVMGGYGFFLRTSKDPSFEGFFESRFNAKQKKLMKMKKFDIQRFNELKRMYYPSAFPSSTASAHHFDHSQRTLIGASH